MYGKNIKNMQSTSHVELHKKNQQKKWERKTSKILTNRYEIWEKRMKKKKRKIEANFARISNTLFTCIHTYIHAYMHTFIDTNVHMYAAYAYNILVFLHFILFFFSNLTNVCLFVFFSSTFYFWNTISVSYSRSPLVGAKY